MGELLAAGFDRVEKDDRLLDVLPDKTREKGIELWEQWSHNSVRLVAVPVPFNATKLRIWQVPRSAVERSLLQPVCLVMPDAYSVAVGHEVASCI